MKCQKIAALVLAAGSILNTLPAFAQETSVYEIKSKEDLFALKEQESVGSVRLCADLDLSGMNAEQYLIPSLAGTFDGGGHTISNLKLAGKTGNWGTTYNTGLIGELTGTVTNLNLENITIEEGSCGFSYVGTIAGFIPDGHTAAVDQCTVTGNISISSGSQLYIGALVGGVSGMINQDSSLTVQSCVSSVTISGSSSGYAGGILGYVGYYCTLDLSNSAILGNLSNGTVCGIIGYAPSKDAKLHLNNSYYAGKLSGSGKKRIITHNISELSELTCQNVYYDSQKNSYTDTLNKGYSSVTGITGYKTAELPEKVLKSDIFEIRPGEFNGYPVPKRAETAPDWGISFSGNNAVVSAAEDGTYYVIFAAYKGKTLKSAAMIKNTFTAGETTVTAPSAFVTDGADTVRAMLLDSPETLHPLTPAATK